MWKWNYLTLKTLSTAKCTLCDATFRPALATKDLMKHLQVNITDKQHGDAFHSIKRTSQWDEHYLMTRMTEILHPNVKCKYCHQIISIFQERFVGLPKKFSKHLRKTHHVNEENWNKLRDWIIKKADNYGITNDKEVIILEICMICDSNIEATSGIMILKHLIMEHFNDIKNFPQQIIPKELHFLLLNRNIDDTLSIEQPSSDPGNIPGTSSGVIPGASPVNPFAAGNIALSIDQPSSDPGNIPGTSSETSAQEYSSSSKRKRDSTTKTDRKRRKLSPIDSEDSD